MDQAIIPFSDNQEQLFLEFARNWMRLLADNKFDEACELLTANKDGNGWTANKFLTVVNETFNPKTYFYNIHPEGIRFTSPDGLVEREDNEPIEFADGSGYWVDYDIPLNGEWSDLTAQFIFHKQQGGYVVELYDLHVL